MGAFCTKMGKMEAEWRPKGGAEKALQVLPKPPSTFQLTPTAAYLHHCHHCISGQSTTEYRATGTTEAPAFNCERFSSSDVGLHFKLLFAPLGSSKPTLPLPPSASSINHRPHTFGRAIQHRSSHRLSHIRYPSIHPPPSTASHSHSLPPYHSIAGGATPSSSRLRRDFFSDLPRTDKRAS